MRHSLTERARQLANHHRLVYIGLALLAACFLGVQLFKQNIPIGWDNSFHYNRFYESAMQLKHGNFSYFTSLYSFASTGRMINALYSPVASYLNGALLLITGSWFRYYLVSSWMMYFLGMSTLYYTMTKLNVRPLLRLGLPIFYATTFPITSWVFEQTFKSWAVVFLPLAILPGIAYVQTGKVKTWPLAFSVAIMAQLHLLSTLFLLLIDSILFGYGWLRSTQKGKDCLQIVMAALVCLLLTLNVWLPSIDVHLHNHMLPVAVNDALASDTIDLNGISHVAPRPLALVIILALVLALKREFRSLSRDVQGLTLVSVTLLLLSTSLFPWRFLAGRGLSFLELIQFPYRFFDYAVPISLILLGLILSRYSFTPRNRKLMI